MSFSQPSPRKSVNTSMMSVEDEEAINEALRIAEMQEAADAAAAASSSTGGLTQEDSLEAKKKRYAQSMLRLNSKRVKLCETPTSAAAAAQLGKKSAARRCEQRKPRLSFEVNPVHQRLNALERELERATLPLLTEIKAELMAMKTEAVKTEFSLYVAIDQVLNQLYQRERDVGLADSFKTNGNTFFSAGMFEDAIRCYRQAYELDAGNAVHYSNCAAALTCMGRFDEALIQGERAIKCDASFTRAYLRCAQALLGMGKLDFAMQKTELAAKMCNSSNASAGEVEEMQRRIRALGNMIQETQNLIKLGQFSAAWNKSLECQAMAPASCQIKLLEITSRLLVATKSAHSNESSSKLIKQFMKEIETNFAKTKPQEASQHICALGAILWSSGLFTEATQYFRLAKAWAPLDETARTWWDLCAAVDSAVRKAKQCQDEHKFEASLLCCEEALKLTSESPMLSAKILVMRANSYALLHRFREAEADCTRALELSPSCFKARLARAQLFLAQAQFFRVEEELSKVEAGFAHVLKQAHINEIATIRETVRRRYAEQQQRGKPASAKKDVPPTRSPPRFAGSAKKENARPGVNTPAAKTQKQFAANATHYVVLGLDPKATTAEAKKAYKRMALRFHPDKNSEPDAAECFKRIAEAADVLLSPTKRRAYDINMRIF